MDAKTYLGRCLYTLVTALALAVTSSTSMSFASDVSSSIESDGLRTVHEKAAARYSTVQQISAREFTALRGQETRAPLVLDIREKSEHAVSHLAGAVQVMPGISAEGFMRRFGGAFRGRTVIVYCSVGVRSMGLADRMQAAIKAAGAKATYNLAGGIFNWHNQSRPLVSKRGRTERVHPYNWVWSRLVKRRNLVSYDAAAPLPLLEEYRGGFDR